MDNLSDVEFFIINGVVLGFMGYIAFSGIKQWG